MWVRVPPPARHPDTFPSGDKNEEQRSRSQVHAATAHRIAAKRIGTYARAFRQNPTSVRNLSILRVGRAVYCVAQREYYRWTGVVILRHECSNHSLSAHGDDGVKVSIKVCGAFGAGSNPTLPPKIKSQAHDLL